MNLPPPRIRIRTLLVLIAVCAVLFRVGQETWGDKTERWLATLQSDHSERREEAASSLAENANRVDLDLAMPTLTAALKDRNVEVRRSVVAVLFQLGVRSDSAIPVLVQAIKDEDVIACIMTVEGLGDCVKMDQRREIVIAALIEALRDKSDTVRCRAAKSLAKWGVGEKGVAAMVEILRSRYDRHVQQRLRQAHDAVGEARGTV